MKCTCMPEDPELLRLYTETGAESAFTALVQRHLPLVHSAALRQTGGDLSQAEEVAQTVFALLARKSAELQRHPTLIGWLYTTTYHTAAKARRADLRRRNREQEVQIMHDAEETSLAADWTELRPVIDDVMLQLKDEDRTAVLLRFFENRTHGEIGVHLGLNENTARMRVDRALNALRLALARRGIVSTATALGAALSGQAVTTPPVGLAASISLGATASTAGGGLLFLMNSTLLKTVALTAVIGAGTAGLVWQRQKNELLQSEIRQLRVQSEARATQSAEAHILHSDSPAGASRLLEQINVLRNSPANSWQERAGVLSQLVLSVPGLNIPEIQLATEEDWLDATKQPMETEDDYRRALAQLRNVVIGRFAGDMRKAITQFTDKNGGRFPTDPAQLESYLEHSLGPSVWQRYEIRPAGSMPTIKVGGDWIITQKAPIDDEYDGKFVIGPYGTGMTTYNSLATQTVLAPVMKAYVAANPGKQPTDLDQLLPFASTPEQRAAIAKQKKHLDRKSRP